MFRAGRKSGFHHFKRRQIHVGGNKTEHGECRKVNQLEERYFHFFMSIKIIHTCFFQYPLAPTRIFL
ncbi:Uncharacterised protein [Vibrio cholerae]|nr:Uncharacterised protein [Vibrio cholerae]